MILISVPFQSRSGVAGGGGGGEQGEAFAAGPEAGAESVGAGAEAQEAGARLKSERRLILFPNSTFLIQLYEQTGNFSARQQFPGPLHPAGPDHLAWQRREADGGGRRRRDPVPHLPAHFGVGAPPRHRGRRGRRRGGRRGHPQALLVITPAGVRV